jgi:hypothetical protein
MEKWQWKFCISGSAALLASYLAKCKSFIAHFSYTLPVTSQNVFSSKLKLVLQ